MLVAFLQIDQYGAQPFVAGLTQNPQMLLVHSDSFSIFRVHPLRIFVTVYEVSTVIYEHVCYNLKVPRS